MVTYFVCFVPINLNRESIGNHQSSQDWNDILLVFTSRIDIYHPDSRDSIFYVEIEALYRI